MNDHVTKEPLLIVGLGNPGVAYETTRHNVGSLVTKSFAHEMGWEFHKKEKFQAELAHGTWDGEDIYLMLPTTYMNNSGIAIKSFLDYYKLDLKRVLILVDDIYLDFGRLRLREYGSPAGHNGLKSVEMHLMTDDYYRLKIGIGQHTIGSLSEHVLDNFREDELEKIPEIIKNARAVLGFWIKGDVLRAKEWASKASLVSQGE